MPAAQRSPCHHRAALAIAAWLTAIVVIIPAVVYIVSKDWGVAIVMACIFLVFDVVFAISQFLTSHEVDERGITLRQGWYYRHTFRIEDITLVQKVQQGPFIWGMHRMGRSVRYVNGTRNDLILMEPELADGGRYRILFDVMSVTSS